jgi:plastocyanin
MDSRNAQRWKPLLLGVMGVLVAGGCSSSSSTAADVVEAEAMDVTEADLPMDTAGDTTAETHADPGMDPVADAPAEVTFTAENGCDPATATDMTGQANVTINFGGTLGLVFVPACLKVTAGTMVTFEGDFTMHVLTGGVVANGVATPDPNSPIKQPATSAGSAEFTLSTPGSYPFYCAVHYSLGMYGAVYVR